MSLRRLRICGTTLPVVFVLLQPIVLAQATYTLDRRDAVFVAVTGAAALLPMLADVEDTCTCSLSGLNGIDRGTALRTAASLNAASYVVAASAIALPVTLSALRSKSWSDPVVIGEALLANTAMNQIVKYSVQRPRPLLYGLPSTDSRIGKPDNHLSFYSQHTSAVFATGMSYARTFALRHPQSRYRWAVYSAVGATGATVGWMRVRARKHFPTDVVTGAVAGGAIGLAVPWLHPKQGQLGTGLSPYLRISPTRSGAMVSLLVPLNP